MKPCLSPVRTFSGNVSNRWWSEQYEKWRPPSTPSRGKAGSRSDSDCVREVLRRLPASIFGAHLRLQRHQPRHAHTRGPLLEKPLPLSAMPCAEGLLPGVARSRFSQVAMWPGDCPRYPEGAPPVLSLQGSRSVSHIFVLIGFRNRFRVMVEWILDCITFKPGARLIYGKPRGLREEGAVEASEPP